MCSRCVAAIVVVISEDVCERLCTVSGGGLLMFEHKIVDLHPQIVNLDPKIVVDGTAAPRDK